MNEDVCYDLDYLESKTNCHKKNRHRLCKRLLRQYPKHTIDKSTKHKTDLLIPTSLGDEFLFYYRTFQPDLNQKHGFVYAFFSTTTLVNDVPFIHLNTIPATMARSKLDTGPAAATFIISVRGFLKFRPSTGTGLAQPNPTNRIIREPIISRCAMGFRVRRPILAAVLSPHFSAIHAWANS